MREILFRGKRTDNSEWVEGRLLAKDVIVPTGQPFVVEANFIYADDLRGYDVDPETVGQFTGLCDKNGKKIFEGDIVNLPQLYGGGLAVIKYFGTAFKACGEAFVYQVLERMEVIGNIYDNPELLEG